MNLRELNYILIPSSTERLERLTDARLGRLIWRLTTPLHSLTREGQVLAVMTLVAGAAGIDVRFSHLYLVFCGLVGLFVAALVGRRFARLRQVELRIEHPPRVAVGQPVQFTAVVTHRGEAPVYALRIHGPFLPWDGTWIRRRPSVPVLEPGDEVRVTLEARFIMRGERYLGRFFVGSVAPLGIMRGNRVYSEPVRLTVVPAVAPVSAPLPPAVARPPEGRDLGGFAGDAFELLGVRPYRPGDRIRDLHARSWARLGEPMVREYRTPVRRRVRVALFGAMRNPQREWFDGAAALAASLAAWAAHGENRVELITATGKPGEVVIGRDGVTLDRALDLLAVAEAGRSPPDSAARIVAGVAGGEPIYLVLADWSAAQRALIAAVRSRAPSLRPLVVTGDRRALAAARTAGVPAFTPAEVEAGVSP